MQHNIDLREKFISMLKDSVLMLCKNGLMDDHGITRVEGLLGITLQNHEVFLINIKEELLPAPVTTCKIEDEVLSGGGKIESGTSPLISLTSSERQSSGRFACRGKSVMNSKSSDGSPTQEELRSRDNREGNDRKNCESESAFVLEELSSDVSFDIADSGTVVLPNHRKEDNRLRSMHESEIEELSSEENSKSFEHMDERKEEPQNLAYNLCNSAIGQLQNFDNGFINPTTTDCSAVALWLKDPRDVGLSKNVIRPGYLPPMLNFPGHVVNRPSLSPSPPFVGHPNILHPYYVNSTSRPRPQASNQKQSYKMSGRQTKKYCCDVCSYKSNRSYNLLRHVMHVHYTCHACGLVFSSYMLLQEHRLEKHENGVPFPLLGMVKQEQEEQVNS